MKIMNSISITSLSSYLYCPIKFYIENVLKIRKIDRSLVIKGLLKHKAIENITKNEDNVVKNINSIKDLNTISTIYKMHFLSNLRSTLIENQFEIDDLNLSSIELFSKFKPLFEFEACERAKNLFNFQSKTQLTGKELWKKLSPKFISEKSVKSKEYGIHGRIDRLELWDDKIVPVEFKDRTSEKIYDSQRIQLGSYILLSHNLYLRPCKYGYIHFLKDNQKKLVVMNEFLKDEIMNVKNKVIELKENKKIPNINNIKISPNKCKFCQHIKLCKKLKEEM